MMPSSRSRPLLWQSKPLCLSCVYLLSSVLLAIYLSMISPNTRCLFRYSSPLDPVQSPLFSYPPSYGQHKHPLPTLRSTCSSPIFFSDYSSVVREIQESCRNSSSSEFPKYVATEKHADSFGGSFSVKERNTFFYQGSQGSEVSCGFVKPFPIANSEQSREYRVGAWRLVNVSVRELYPNAAMNGVIPKYLVHPLFPNAKYSVWVDAKIQLVVDPLLLIHSLVIKENADMAISRHPFFVHTMEEAMATARWKKWPDVDSLRMQMETYCENGLRPWSPKKLPYPSDVPDSAVIVRKHEAGSNLFSCLMFNELDAFNPRDQLAFAYVRDKMRHTSKQQFSFNINMFNVEVFEQIALEYRHKAETRLRACPRSKDQKGTARFLSWYWRPGQMPEVFYRDVGRVTGLIEYIY